MIDLNPNHLETVRRILAEHVPAYEVRAFGSRVTWTAKDYSDLDLAVVGVAALDRGTLARLKEAFEESDMPMQVDVLDWHGISRSFQEVIERDYAVIQGAGTEPTRVRNGWQNMVLGEVCTKIGSGATPKGGKNTYLPQGPYALIRSQNVYNDGFAHEGLAFINDDQANDLKNVEVMPGDVFLNITGDSVTRVCQVEPGVLPARVNQHVAIVRPDPDKLAPRFLRYYLVSPQIQNMLLSWADSGSTRKALTKKMIESLEVSAPADVDEQRAIAHILGTLDDKIELNRRMNETLEEMARALFKSWFVDFDPVRAKMDGRWRRGQSLPGMPAALFDLFPDRLVNSELGEIPEGWEVKALGKLFVAKNVRLGNVDVPEYSCTNEGVIPRSERFTKKLSLSNAKNKVISKGDFVFGLSRRVLNFGLMRDDIGCVSPAYRTYSTNQGLVIPDLLERIMRLQSEYFYLAVSSSSREGQSISQDALYGLQVTLPAIAIQQFLYQTIERISLRTAHALMENRQLGILRETLLPKLMSGGVRVGGVAGI